MLREELELVLEKVGGRSVRHSSVRSTNYGRGGRMNGISRWRAHGFKAIIPRRLSEHSESELKLMLVSLKNVRNTSAVHILRIEKELKKRGCQPSILARRGETVTCQQE
ncbi:MAG: hypothetical protein ACFFAY_04300 [Promethearchaeota archaeon]